MLHLVFRDLDMAALHSSMTVRALLGFLFHVKKYTILEVIKVIGEWSGEIYITLKEYFWLSVLNIPHTCGQCLAKIRFVFPNGRN
jgi:hypothetical protein